MKTYKSSADRYLSLIGSVIQQAICDYESEAMRQKNWIIWTDAKDFLFADNRLEKFINKYHLDNYLNCEYVRKQVNRQGEIKQ